MNSFQQSTTFSGYDVETIERLFRRFKSVDTTDTSSSSGVQAVSATNQLLVIRERLQAGLSARLLELKMEMDKEFGTAFVDMESYLRTEKGTTVIVWMSSRRFSQSLFPSHPIYSGRWLSPCACPCLAFRVLFREKHRPYSAHVRVGSRSHLPIGCASMMATFGAW